MNNDITTEFAYEFVAQGIWDFADFQKFLTEVVWEDAYEEGRDNGWDAAKETYSFY